MFYVGVDGGNSTIKVVVNGDKILPAFPSIAAKGESINYNMVVGKRTELQNKYGHDKLDVTVTTHRDKTNSSERRFFFGDLAAEYNYETRNGTKKSTDKDLLNWMLTAIAYSIFEYRKAKGEQVPKKAKAEVAVGTGLPYWEAQDNQNRLAFEESLIGNHLVKFNDPWFGGLEMELNITDARCFMEGESALYTVLYDEKYGFQDSDPMDLIGHLITIVEMGGGSTEIVTYAFGEAPTLDIYNNDNIQVTLDFRPQFTGGIKKGIGNVMTQTIADLKKYEEKLKDRDLRKRDIEKAIARNFTILPEKIKIDKYFNENVNDYIDQTVAKINQLLETQKSRLKKIYLAGGGSKVDVVVEKLKEALGSLGFDTDKVVCLSDGVYANALGYYENLLDALGVEDPEEERE
ncbi:MAG: ParM/StbA family protein [Thermosipho sp. (in: Bacteria)]|nr:ParM/StbA family protein [Thermosipho sp. (in: thermotogales)]